ncbi:MAG: ABC transporter ATP-binding protein [Oscillospiraceae bacterium]|nr:ABC transporter ATP-binding protein [Oscillospiraceae bacterium]
MIEVKNLVKQYGDHIAVDHLSFTVEPGQIYGFLGPNGAGKSTTMNIMTGYLGATSGEVLINGHDILEEPEEAKKCIGYLPELPPLYTDMTVEEYLRFVAELKKVPKKERKGQLERILNLCHLQEMRGRLIRNLSKGYKQRVGLAQAITGFPDIIILDEPTVGLDPKQIIEIRDLMRTLAQEHTVILSSHILSEVQEVCDTILIINKGKLVACDTPDNLESSLSGGNRLELSVKGSRAEAEQILSAVEGINDLQLKETAETVELVITSDASMDLRETLFYAFAEARCPILMMKHTETSLENVFLQLTSGDPVETEEPAEQDESTAEPAEPAEAGDEPVEVEVEVITETEAPAEYDAEEDNEA